MITRPSNLWSPTVFRLSPITQVIQCYHILSVDTESND